MSISSTKGSINLSEKQREGHGLFLIFTMAILGLLTIGISTGPVIASLIIGPFGDPATGYAFAWGIAALLALAAIAVLMLNKLDLKAVTDRVPHEERS